MTRKIEEGGGRVATRSKVVEMRENSGGWTVRTTAGDWEADYVVNCGGLHSDRVAQMAGKEREVRIVPFRGEYFKIKPARQFLVRNLIYPVPDPQFPFLGVHFTRLIEGGVEAGPNAVLAFAREGYRKTDINPLDLFDALSFPGLWRFLNQHRRMCWEEMKRSFSRRLFCQACNGSCRKSARTTWRLAAPVCARKPCPRRASRCMISATDAPSARAACPENAPSPVRHRRPFHRRRDRQFCSQRRSSCFPRSLATSWGARPSRVRISSASRRRNPYSGGL